MRPTIILIAILLACASCKKVVTKVNKDFVGFWFTDHPDEHLSVYEDNTGEYRYYSNKSMEGDIHYKGTVRCNDKKLKIGLWHSFDIVEAPNPIDTTLLNWPQGGPKPTWQMNLNGTIYRRK